MSRPYEQHTHTSAGCNAPRCNLPGATRWKMHLSLTRECLTGSVFLSAYPGQPAAGGLCRACRWQASHRRCSHRHPRSLPQVQWCAPRPRTMQLLPMQLLGHADCPAESIAALPCSLTGGTPTFRSHIECSFSCAGSASAVRLAVRVDAELAAERCAIFHTDALGPPNQQLSLGVLCELVR